jgi:hypothetical protein
VELKMPAEMLAFLLVAELKFIYFELIFILEVM